MSNISSFNCVQDIVLLPHCYCVKLKLQLTRVFLQWSFYAGGAFCVAWCAAWFLVITDDPVDHAWIDEDVGDSRWECLMSYCSMTTTF